MASRVVTASRIQRDAFQTANSAASSTTRATSTWVAAVRLARGLRRSRASRQAVCSTCDAALARLSAVSSDGFGASPGTTRNSGWLSSSTITPCSCDFTEVQPSPPRSNARSTFVRAPSARSAGVKEPSEARKTWIVRLPMTSGASGNSPDCAADAPRARH
ncbi:MAG: hypothetical protein IPP87_11885 [Ideonella sp.]|nr:hypothetical protein [Ideonella sp.]